MSNEPCSLLIYKSEITNYQSVVPEQKSAAFYCPQCAQPVADPLTCGDCGSLICRVCGSPLESADELAIG
jgi:hypothetical protein